MSKNRALKIATYTGVFSGLATGAGATVASSDIGTALFTLNVAAHLLTMAWNSAAALGTTLEKAFQNGPDYSPDNHRHNQLAMSALLSLALAVPSMYVGHKVAESFMQPTSDSSASVVPSPQRGVASQQVLLRV